MDLTPITGGGGASVLDDLNDVVISSATEGDVLNFRNGSWVNTSSPHIGSGTKPTSPASGDVSLYGRMYIGSSVSESDAFVSNQNLSVKKDVDISNSTPPDGYSRFLFNLAPIGTVAAGSHSLLKILVAGGTGITSGNSAVHILEVAGNFSVPSGVNCSIDGLVFTSALSGTGAFTIVAGNFGAVGSVSGGTTTSMVGVQAKMSNAASVATELVAFRATNVSGASISAAVTQATAYDVGPFASDTDVVTWSGLRISTNPLAAIANKWSLDLTNNTTNMGSRIVHKTAIGWNPSTVAAITSRLHLAAGTAAASTSPMKYTSGPVMTTAEAGAAEFLTDDFFLTITTGAARKGIVLDDGARLTSGIVPVATTNGRLIDGLTLASGVYTPTLTNVANLDASTAFQCQYMRVGSVVTVSGKVSVDPTLTATTTQLGISLPIASNIGAEEDCCGTASAKAISSQVAAILGDATNDRAQMEWKATDITNQAMYFSFTYRII